MTDNRPLPERLFDAGLTDLIPVIPPGASLAPSSKIAPDSIGKIPGLRRENGLWVGCNWRAIATTADDVREWQRWGANIGLRSDRFPAVDIDCADAALAAILESLALAELGAAPVRIGNPPKRLLPYRLAANEMPFGRLRLWMKKGDTKYLVEILGTGFQYVVHGIHPKTGQAYAWNVEPTAGLTEITLADAKRFLEQAKATVEMLGYECELQGDGSGLAVRRADQDGLRAPSLEELRELIDILPNKSSKFPTRDDWLRVGAAIKAAAGEENEPEAIDLFLLWSGKWDEGSNDPDYARNEFRRLKSPYSVGWPLLAELARPYGWNDAPFDVDAVAPDTASTGAEPKGPPFLSDQWLAAKVVEACHPILRYVPANGTWLVWSKHRWLPDAQMLAEDTVKLELRKIANWVEGHGATDQEKKKSAARAQAIASAGKVESVMKLVKCDRAIAVAPESLDFDPWILNTTGGIVDLKTGELRPSDPDQLCTRSTSVAPDFGGAHPVWDAFLDEATGGDRQLQAYLKRLAGYCLTGSTREQQFTFIYGDGGNGKGTFLKVMMGVLDRYHRDSPMETFIASSNERHPTELAMLAGARLVTASETDAGRRWDEPKLKRMTGGDPITARAMREDFFTYLPQFKLVFIGNNKPTIRNIDRAMRRRTHLVPFVVHPKVVDNELDLKLRAEFPAILAWMIEGCLEWQKLGLQPPQSVCDATEEYFAESDPVGQWLQECTVKADVDAEPVDLLELWDSWREWANRREEYQGKMQILAQKLVAKHYQKGQHPRTRRTVFRGLKVINQAEPFGAVA